ncbi:poly-gamma-glutamate biosynthesis protein PgsC/CapC [Halorientalis halophila]|uniref:poly-gamma-glutamate biosynthesis protein PgsC/CapC n=1 Tax=Halorientalis halophila TaxID=3108499 RepID=UPI00300B48FA
MLVAGLLIVLGLLSVATLTQWYGYRLGGAITVSVIAVYTLKNVVMLPIFVLSFAVAYVGLQVLKDRTLIYGRQELLAAIVVGSLVPLGMLYTLTAVADQAFQSILFIGSIIPGLAAFNYHQLKPERRRTDLFVATGLLGALLVLGYLLITPANAARLGGMAPPVLFSQTADVAAFKGAAVSTPPEPSLIKQRLGAVVLLIGMVFAESVRARFGLRVGIVSIALLAVFTLASIWLPVVFALVFAVSYVLIEAINRTTLLYGRVLVGIGTAIAVVLVIPLSVELPVVRGLSALFAGILGGLSAYNFHVTASGHRRTFAALSVAIFVPLLGLALLVGRPQPNAPIQSLTPTAVAVMGVITAISFAVAYWLTPTLPDDESVHAASILSGGDGA